MADLGSKVGVYALGQSDIYQWGGILVNVKSRSETSIVADIYSQRDDTVNNIYYRYKSGEIEAASGYPANELETIINDIFHDILTKQGVENFDITINPNVIPTTVDYLIPNIG